MSRFLGRFYKHVLGANGQVGEICQSTFELDAADEVRAIEAAKRMFCDLHQIHDWTLHADRMDIEPADFPS